MIEILVFILLYYVIKWLLIITVGIVALRLIVKLIQYIVSVTSANKKTKQAEKTYGKDSIGAFLARNEADAARGDYDALISTSVDRRNITEILDWFTDVVEHGKYYAIHEKEAAEGEPNYAFIMDNNSGFDFKEFSCDISVKEGEKSLGTVVGTAKNWKNKTEGKIWFYCAGTVNKATIDVRSLKYDIDMDPEEDKKRRAQNRAEILTSASSLGYSDSDYDESNNGDIHNENDFEPFLCPECFEPYDGIYCENCGYSNDDPGYEEDSDDEKWIENIVAVAMMDAEDRKRDAINNDSFFGEEIDEDDIY